MKPVSLFFLTSSVLGLAFADRARGADAWSSRGNWEGAVPQEGEVVTIPAGTDMVLDTDPPALGGLLIKGSLTFARKDLRLTSRWIVIAGGALHIGSADALHTDDALITLKGTDETESVTGGGHHPVGTKCIAVTNGGRLELHGARAGDRNWTQLAGHALRGAAQFRVAEPVIPQ